jgi:hypothetical protein
LSSATWPFQQEIIACVGATNQLFLFLRPSFVCVTGKDDSFMPLFLLEPLGEQLTLSFNTAIFHR